jgi:toxin ParE1/3/4
LRILWTEAASEDLEALCAYVGADNPTAAARQVLPVVEAVENLLPQKPALGRPGRVPGTRELVVPKTPYIVAYRIKLGVLQVLRVPSAARLTAEPAP